MKEFKAQFQGWEREAGWVLISSVVLMVLFAYQGHPDFFKRYWGNIQTFRTDIDFYSEAYRFFYTFITFFLIPVIIIKFVFKKKLSDYGLQFGDKKFGFRFVMISYLIIPLPLYFSLYQNDFLNEYPLWDKVGTSATHFLLWIGLYLFYYIGWEFFFRGYLQFSLKGVLTPFFIIMIQTIASTIIHIGKPEGETMSAIIGGIVFGALALRTRSILYPLLIHWYVGALTELFCYFHKVGL